MKENYSHEPLKGTDCTICQHLKGCQTFNRHPTTLLEWMKKKKEKCYLCNWYCHFLGTILNLAPSFFIFMLSSIFLSTLVPLSFSLLSLSPSLAPSSPLSPFLLPFLPFSLSVFLSLLLLLAICLAFIFETKFIFYDVHPPASPVRFYIFLQFWPCIKWITNGINQVDSLLHFKVWIGK